MVSGRSPSVSRKRVNDLPHVVLIWNVLLPLALVLESL